MRPALLTALVACGQPPQALPPDAPPSATFASERAFVDLAARPMFYTLFSADAHPAAQPLFAFFTGCPAGHPPGASVRSPLAPGGSPPPAGAARRDPPGRGPAPAGGDGDPRLGAGPVHAGRLRRLPSRGVAPAGLATAPLRRRGARA